MLTKLVGWTGWLLPLLLIVPGITLVARGGGGGTEIVLAALAAAALGTLLHLLLRSLGTLLAQLDQPPPAPNQRLRDLEREKQLLLRSIREVEFDAGLQRLDDEQAAQLVAPLRQRALQVLQQLDAARVGQAPARLDQQIEQELKRRLGRSATALVLALSALSHPARAQAPGGTLPAEMLGQPLPSADLPAGVLTVKVIGSDLNQAQPDQTVELFRSGAAAMARVAGRKSGPDGRARFEGLVEGQLYLALLRQGDQAIPSRPFRLAPGAGIKLLLSTRSPARPLAAALALDEAAEPAAAEPAPESGAAADAEASDDPHAGVPGAPGSNDTTGAATLSAVAGLAADRIEVLTLRGPAREPLAGAKVTLARSGRPDETQRTDAQGRAIFSLRAASTASNAPRAAPAPTEPDPASFSLRVEHDGLGYRSAELTAKQAGGRRATFTVYDRTTSRKDLQLGPGTHVLAQLSEGRLSCTHIIVLLNPGPRLVDLGESGLRLPLPRGAVGAALSEETQGVARLEGDEATIVVGGPLPPGQLVLQTSYELPYDGSSLDFHQPLPLGSPRTLLALGEAPAVEVVGPALEARELRRHQGVAMQLFTLAPVARGKSLELTVRNLPHRAEWPRQLVLGLSALIALWAIAGIVQGRRHAARRAAQRSSVLEALVALEGRHAAGAVSASAYERERRALVAQARLVWDAGSPEAASSLGS
ncbi:MAG: hypothetical protein IPG96_05070 [Proteobacteria bacterium]|nr:hypothetical protein [Pseudomonadota bacterium]